MLVIVLGLAWLYGPKRGGTAADPMELRMPVATLPFSDGHQLEVFGLAEDEWVVGMMTAPKGRWIYRTTASVHSHGPEKDWLQVESFELDGKLAGVRLWIREGCLMMSLRLLDPHGYPVSEERMKSEGFAIHLSDGAGEWIRGLGPYGAGDDPESRAVVAFEGWPRSGPELAFKAVLAGLPPVEFRLPNPAAGRKPATWVAEILPQTRSGEFWDLELKEVREVLIPGKGRGLYPVFKFESQLAKPTDGWSRIDAYGDGIEGARGTHSSYPLEFNTDDGKLRAVYPAPPDEDRFKIFYKIQYRQTYPFPRDGVVIIAEGVVGADGESVKLISRNEVLGIQKIEVSALAEKRKLKGEKGFSIHFEGRWSNAAEQRAAEAQVGPWKGWRCVVFTDRAERSSGGVRFERDEISTGIMNPTFEWTGRWTGEPQPGMRIEIGIMPMKPDDVMEFVIDRPSIVSDGSSRMR